jgi:hypothetical protein
MVSTRHVSSAHRARHLLRTYVSERPALYLPFARRKYPGPSPEVISSETELVIDGYTRSASTFAVYALQLSQQKPVRLAHHLHAPAQLVEAARRGVPALLLIREPQGALLSQLVREPDVALRDALIAYTRFHACLLPYRDRLVVADFDTVTHDFGSVIRRLNARFGTSFVEFRHTENNMRDCLELMKHRSTLSEVLLGFESGLVSREAMRREQQALDRKPVADTRDAWVPSENRAQAKAELRDQWLRPDLTKLRERAQQMYRTFIAQEQSDGANTGPMKEGRSP